MPSGAGPRNLLRGRLHGGFLVTRRHRSRGTVLLATVFALVRASTSAGYAGARGFSLYDTEAPVGRGALQSSFSPWSGYGYGAQGGAAVVPPSTSRHGDCAQGGYEALALDAMLGRRGFYPGRTDGDLYAAGRSCDDVVSYSGTGRQLRRRRSHLATEGFGFFGGGTAG